MPGDCYYCGAINSLFPICRLNKSTFTRFFLLFFLFFFSLFVCAFLFYFFLLFFCFLFHTVPLFFIHTFDASHSSDNDDDGCSHNKLSCACWCCCIFLFCSSYTDDVLLVLLLFSKFSLRKVFLFYFAALGEFSVFTSNSAKRSTKTVFGEWKCAVDAVELNFSIGTTWVWCMYGGKIALVLCAVSSISKQHFVCELLLLHTETCVEFVCLEYFNNQSGFFVVVKFINWINKQFLDAMFHVNLE